MVKATKIKKPYDIVNDIAIWLFKHYAPQGHQGIGWNSVSQGIRDSYLRDAQHLQGYIIAPIGEIARKALTR